MRAALLGTSIFLSCVLASSTLEAQTPYLVRDVNATTVASPVSSYPNSFFRYGSRVLFVAATESGGTALWITDGTAAGTSRLAGIYPLGRTSSQNQFVLLNGKVIFNALDAEHGEELWTTDGTADGTHLLDDIQPGIFSSNPGDRIVYHGQLFFGASDGKATNLWVTDGTEEGTRVFKTLNPAPGGVPQSFVILNDTLYFWADHAIWKSDGTESGTVPMTAMAVQVSLTAAGSHLFFTGYSPESGIEPWVSDGTAAGTHMLLDTNPGSAGSQYSDFVPFGDGIVFGAFNQYGSQLWISDGTTTGNHVIHELFPALTGPNNLPSIAVIGATAFVSAAPPGSGPELWRTDGTDAGTALVRDLVPGFAGSAPADLAAVGGRLYFTASTGGVRTLWTSDGTASGTREVTAGGVRIPVLAQTRFGAARPFSTEALDGAVFFSGASGLNGYELWRTDGTDAGTFMVANLAAEEPPSSNPGNLVAAADWIYFDAWDGSGPVLNANGGPRSLWRSDGTAAGTLKMTDAPASAEVPDGRALFFSRGSNGSGPAWKSDGTPEGTGPSPIAPRFPPVTTIVRVVGDKVFASVTTPFNYQFWVTTTAPDAPAVQLPSPIGHDFVEVAGRLMYFAEAGTGYMGLWITDGTLAGTAAVVNDFGVPRSAPATAVMGGALYFTEGSNLRKSDGTFDGTVIVKSAAGGFSGLTTAGTKLFFLQGTQLGVTDGTAAGMQTLPATPVGPLAAAGNRVVFAAADTVSGIELWVSDGTAAGTHLLLDIDAGPSSSAPTELTSIDGLVYFSAHEPIHGTEPWVTDGTAEGTHLLAEIVPGPDGSYPRQYVKAGDRIFFTASSAEGTELWAMTLASQRLTVEDTRVTEGDSGTVAARFTVMLSSPSAQTVAVDYATADGTAMAGSDYDAAAGTLTFAPGQTSKVIDVRVRGDLTPETNKSFFLILRNASHASIARGVAFAVIEDNDQIADVSLGLDFSLFDNYNVVVKGTNKGPLAATALKLVTTATPNEIGLRNCYLICFPPAELPANGSARLFDNRWPSYQQYHTAAVTARQRDPQPSDNVVSWTTSGAVAMEALYLTPGADVKVWFNDFQALQSEIITSSDPSVLTAPTFLKLAPSQTLAGFVAHGAGVGTAKLTVTNQNLTLGTITVNVVAPGTAVRWPGAINATVNDPGPFDKPAGVRISTVGTAPYSGATATGVVRVTAGGQELGRLMLPVAATGALLPFYSPVIGTQPIKIEYLGDANFLPMTIDASIFTTKGSVSITSSADRSGRSATLHLRLSGSPMADPGGTVTFSEPNVLAPTQVALTPAGGGTATADVTIAYLIPGVHTVQVTYSGDTHYHAQNQSVRLLEAHRRAAEP